MEIITFLTVGLTVGWAAGVLVPGYGLGTFGDIVVGVIGSLVGGYIYTLIGVTSYGFFGAIAMSTVGAVLFLFVVGQFSRPRKSEEN